MRRPAYEHAHSSCPDAVDSLQCHLGFYCTCTTVACCRGDTPVADSSTGSCITDSTIGTEAEASRLDSDAREEGGISATRCWDAASGNVANATAVSGVAVDAAAVSGDDG